MHAEEITKAAAFAQERAEREARLQRPLFVMPTKGVFTSGFGYRWGVLHGGIDIANSIGTPIVAAADGVVIDAGPTAGYGAWVKLRHADGTVTLYGHVNTWTVNIGQRVWAGDQIATIGNRGNSTGPHLPLRGAAERHRPHRPGRMAGQTGTQPRQLLSVSVSDPDLPETSDERFVSAPKTGIIRRAPSGPLPAIDESRTTHIGSSRRSSTTTYIPRARPVAIGGRRGAQSEDGGRDRGGRRSSAAGPPRSSPPT